MTIEFEPSTLKSILTSPFAEKRLKNRNAVATCNHCGFNEEDRVVLLFERIKFLDENESEHKFILVETTCGFGLF